MIRVEYYFNIVYTSYILFYLSLSASPPSLLSSSLDFLASESSSSSSLRLVAAAGVGLSAVLEDFPFSALSFLGVSPRSITSVSSTSSISSSSSRLITSSDLGLALSAAAFLAGIIVISSDSFTVCPFNTVCCFPAAAACLAFSAFLATPECAVYTWFSNSLYWPKVAVHTVHL